ncbi:hypothetical protein [Trichococcus pasteurii]|uniref:Uncharacterized protein n=1 Tax=Trichococcus pasteurii TaxID=43064 RepID=A0A1W1II80_9LACT|nr:hypothetical protein [Trichococcus pasteurii]SFF09011.1 hypothetical protein SAMN04488086_1264 [Trichococcus pasteurii]SLM52738.1 Hypothetical protein TPAS_2445 [Trichococcus pasteurii]SSB93619.1 Hypothetical protein TPAS_2445 [Trichococcus pasteurii]
MNLYNLRISKNDQIVKLSISVDSKEFGKKELWFSTEKQYANGICTSHFDAFLVGLLFPAMKYGEDIHIEGTVSSKLLFNINHYVIPLIKSFSPSCKKINVTADTLVSENFEGDGVGTGFSGGIDSFCTVYDHFELEDNPEYKINSFLFLNVGAHGSDDENKVRNKYNLRYEYLREFPKEIGLDFISVDSNLYLFHPWGHQKTHTLTSAAGIIFMQKLYSKYYYASAGLDYSDIIKTASNYIDIDVGAYCDSILLPLLSTESLDFIPDGAQYTRVEKTVRIMNYEPVYRYLNVCVSGDDTHENCSVCSKCCRTLMTINSSGKIEDFQNLFDIPKYKAKAEKKYLVEQVLNKEKDPFAKGNINFAKENDIDLPGMLYCRIAGMNWAFKNKLIKFANGNLSEVSKKRLKRFILR